MAAQMILGAFFNPTGHHAASWRHPQADANAGIDFDHYRRIAQKAEAGRFHMIFLADNVGLRDARMEALSRSAQYIANFEPLTLLSALSAVTSKIGLAATASTSFNEPYHIARKFASLDHLSRGRAGWNIVTSTLNTEARNFGLDEHIGHGERYARAREFTEVVLGLWDSWDDDAFVRDVESGLFFDPAKLRALDHRGKYFTVAGPLNVPRSPQGHPVLIQAGASGEGREFAARFAEVIFTNHLTIDQARDYYDDLKRQVAALGRSPDDVKVLPGLSAIVGTTRAEADEKHRYLQSLVDPIVAREMLSTVLGGVDLSPYPLDGPLPDIEPTSTTIVSALENWTKLARDEQLSIRELGLRAAGARGKSVVCGSAADVADHMEAWFTGGGGDGFNIMPAYLPGALDDFVDLVIPELQRRGLFWSDYRGATLREHLGLTRPGRAAAQSRAPAEPLILSR